MAAPGELAAFGRSMGLTKRRIVSWCALSQGSELPCASSGPTPALVTRIRACQVIAELLLLCVFHFR